MFLPWTQNIKGKGEISAIHPKDRPQTVNSVIPGQVVEWYKAEGDSVQKGDTILMLSEVKNKFFDPEMIPRLQEQVTAKRDAVDATQDKLDALDKRVGLLRQNLELSLQKQDNKIKQVQLKLRSDSMNLAAQEYNLEVAQQRFSRYDTLFRKELISRTDYEKRRLKLQEDQAKLIEKRNKYLETQNELINARIERNAIRADYLDKINKAISDRQSARSYLADTRAQVAKMRNELANVEIRNQFQYVRAPRDGYLVRAQTQGIGEVVKEGESIFTIVPQSPNLAAELYLSANDMPFIKKGSKVRCIFEGYPNVVFAGFPEASIGTFSGEVAVIDNVTSQQNQFRILVKPDPETRKDWPKGLRFGAGVQGWVQLAEVPLWFEIWRQINGFPPTTPKGKGGKQSGKSSKTASK
jgi:multidrug resistance efflux pump